MKILVICQYYYPEEFQINDICTELVNRGHKVTVLTGLPNYPTGVIPKEYQKGKKRYEIIDKVEVIRCFEIPRHTGTVGLAKNYLSFCLAASIKAFSLKKNFDVIYVYQLSPVLMAMPGIVLKKLTGKRLFLYCCDLWPESIKILAKNETSLIFKIGKIVSSYIYNQCDCIGIQCQAFEKYFNDVHKIKVSNLKFIPQFANEEYLNQNFTQPHSGTNFMFLGNIGIAQNLDCLVDAVEKMRYIADFHVHIVGDGTYLNKLKQLVETKKLNDKFIFHGRQPSSLMPEFYKLADACLITLSGDNIIGNTIPSKLQGYMAAGKTVIGAIDGSAQEVIKASGCGAVVPAGESEGLARIMEDFIFHRDKYIDCGKAGKDYFLKHFTMIQYIDTTESVFQELVGER